MAKTLNIKVLPLLLVYVLAVDCPFCLHGQQTYMCPVDGSSPFPLEPSRDGDHQGAWLPALQVKQERAGAGCALRIGWLWWSEVSCRQIIHSRWIKWRVIYYKILGGVQSHWRARETDYTPSFQEQLSKSYGKLSEWLLHLP